MRIELTVSPRSLMCRPGERHLMARASADPEVLFSAALRGDRAATARLLSLIERGGEPGRAVGRLAYPKSGEGYTVGLTGAPERERAR